MSKLKIEHRASRISLVLLKTNIEDTIAEDIDLMAAWSDNDRRYIVNELLRFALAQEDGFQRYKASAAKTTGGTKVASSSARTAQDTITRPDAPAPVRS
ncbi:hypothetical protein GCM10011507_26310 [Edaphobacter acidisoli]|uniref:Uncharacterized protein n=1 Tax=Edaphobacter acidisoli TaxID=2040573 RepID=A0A916W7M2_9BACT|nr:hypothetical protein [Edaphobacter acidisoli]GGA73447.1 hypothetical protein GCM10011507_26310 [Edaphobacter acidisoli]